MKIFKLIIVLLLWNCSGIPSEDQEAMENFCKNRYNDHYYDTCMKKAKKFYYHSKEIDEIMAENEKRAKKLDEKWAR